MSATNRRPSRIPESWIPSSEQSYYAYAFVLATQAYKLSDALALSLRSLDPATKADLPTSSVSQLFSYVSGHLPRQGSLASTYLVKWSLLDIVTLSVIGSLHIPGLLQSRGRIARYLPIFLLVNAILFGQIDLGAVVLTVLGWIWKLMTGTMDNVQTLTERSVKPEQVIAEQQHLLGHRSIRKLENGDAIFNPTGATFCLEPGSKQTVYIPILFNNSQPSTLQYAVRSPEDLVPKMFTISAKDLDHPKKAATEKAYKQRKWYEDEDVVVEASTAGSEGEQLRIRDQPNQIGRSVKADDKFSALPPAIRSGENLYYLPVKSTGVIDLLGVKDHDDYGFTVKSTNGPVIVAECPSAGHFVESPETSASKSNKKKKASGPVVRCVGDSDVETVRIKGAGPMTVRWAVTKQGGATTQHVRRDIERDTPKVQVDGQDDAEKQISKRQLNLKTPRIDSTPYERNVPLTIDHSEPGTYEVQVLSIEDGLHNVHHPDVEKAKLVYQVQALPTAGFSPRQPAASRKGSHLFMKENANVTLIIEVKKDVNAKEAVIELQYEPEPGTKHLARTENLTDSRNVFGHTVYRPGTYSLRQVIAGRCQGSVKGLASVVVQEVPPPSSRIEYTAERDCAGDTGFRAHIEFVGGTPPYTVKYASYRSGETHKEYTKSNIYKAKEEIIVRPDRPGKYIFVPISISDSNYKDVPISADRFEQTISPQAEFHLDPRHHRGTGRKEIWTCQTNTTDVHFALKGTAPFIVERAVIWLDQSEIANQTFSSAGKQKISVMTPAGLERDGGQFSVSLTRVWDGHGCMIALPDHNLSFDVRTERPTAKFDATAGVPFSIVEGSSAGVPLKLTGTAPWDVTYQRDGDRQTETFRSNHHDSILKLRTAGKYHLVAVHDKHCPGSVPLEAADVEVEHIPRPEVALTPESDGFSSVSPRRDAVCAGKEDAVKLFFKGQAPFRYRFSHTHVREGHKTTQNTHDAEASTSQSQLALSVVPGKHTYDILQVADRSYDFQADSNAKKSGISVHHTVLERPTASMISRTTSTYCLHDSLTRDKNRAQVEFKGKAPFDIHFSIQGNRRGAPELFNKTGIKEKKWDLDVPDFRFKDAGTYQIKIVNVSDANGCVWEPPEDEDLSVYVNVVEPASVKAITEGTDYCVGDTLEYLLQGTRPWTLSYTFAGKKHKIETDKPNFSRLADRPGTFEITSVSHRKAAHCESPIRDMSTTVHPLPSAQIKDGESWLHEGNVADIEITFKGTPPFAFTWTRSTWVGKKLAIEDTDTVDNIEEYSYTLQSSKQGEYDVIAVSDRYCRVGSAESVTKRKSLKA